MEYAWEFVNGLGSFVGLATGPLVVWATWGDRRQRLSS
ncbi:MAG: hypothetical protein H6Q99_2380 [Proteobacteria bacterium]|nr:hypothetical protein [Pseudomonadota bacterium]